jgi:capsular exopolysaccharide synthesis family protein
MDRIITPYGVASGAIHARPHEGPSAMPPKGGREYLRALRRRWWLALGVCLLIAGVGTIVVLRMPLVYQAQAEVEVVPPQFDAQLSVIVETAAHLNRDNSEQFVLNKVAQLRGKSLIDGVVREFEPGDPALAEALAAEITGGLTTKRVPGTNLFLVTLDSRDQDRVARLLNTLLTAFSNRAYEEASSGINASITKGTEMLNQYGDELRALEKRQSEMVAAAPYFAADGHNVLEDEVFALKSVLLQKRVRLDDLVHEQRLAELWPHLRARSVGADDPSRGAVAELLAQKEQLEFQLGYLKRTVRNFRSDPYVKILSRQLNDILDRIEASGALAPIDAGPDLTRMNVNRAGEEVRELEQEIAEMQVELRRTSPQFQAYLGLLKRREQLEELIAHLGENLVKFKQVAGTLKRPVEISQRASTPTRAARPNRVLGVALVGVFGVVAGVGLVLAMESCDHAVKEPDQLTAGLALPILGVIPRMRRHARLCRGGHLWTPGVPDSLEADAYRSLRAGLLGLEWSERPIVTVLVTSAKAGDGKSTTALNLAAACARAGERTILVDCDLRRPSLGAIVADEAGVGLCDVLRGEMPLGRAIAPIADVDNLDILPSGELGGVPIEALGSRELRDVIGALSREYHRVILDAPAVLGLPDGRILSRLADATILVVRSGSHEIHPLRRAKEFLEQSRARIAGVVFNDLREDLHHWSSDYHPRTPAVAADTEPARRRRLAAPQAAR